MGESEQVRQCVVLNESYSEHDITAVSICCSVSQKKIPSYVAMLGSARGISNIATRPGVYVSH